LSCIDCGETFGQQSVQGHTQCITEAEKYGPKGQGKAPNGTPAKSNNDSKKKPDVDINVGLSSRPPWFCSVCNTSATSKQTLLLHADGKKHRAKARAFHASKQPPKETNELTSNTKHSTDELCKGDSIPTESEKDFNEQDLSKSTSANIGAENGTKPSEKKRKLMDTDDGSSEKKEGIKDSGEVIQAKKKKTKHLDVDEEQNINIIGDTEEVKSKKIKWKKLITSILKSTPEGIMKMKKLQKLVFKSLQESGHSEDENQLKENLVDKINSSSRFTLDNKLVRLAAKS
ncbi:Ubp1-associated proteins 1c, partial [Thalictrum thalictroides]